MERLASCYLPNLCCRATHLAIAILSLTCTLHASAKKDYIWTLQARLTVPEAGEEYGMGNFGLVGRGYTTMISGYNKVDPGIYIHTTDDGYAYRGKAVWTQQAKLRPMPVSARQVEPEIHGYKSPQDPGDDFGHWMVSYNQTILVSSPLGSFDKQPRFKQQGLVYVFNGSLRQWSQIQRLRPDDGASLDNFGTYMVLQGDRVVIGASNQNQYTGAVYVFERPKNGLFWSRTAKLKGRDTAQLSRFGESFTTYDIHTVVSARNDDDQGDMTGSAYVFKQFAGRWSQQQKLVAKDLWNYNDCCGGVYYVPRDPFIDKAWREAHPDTSQDVKEFFTRCSSDVPPEVEAVDVSYAEKNTDLSKYPRGFDKETTKCGNVKRRDQEPRGDRRVYEGVKKFGYDISLFGKSLAITYQRLDKAEDNTKSVYIFAEEPSISRWSLQQMLFAGNDTHGEAVSANADMRSETKLEMGDTTLIATIRGPKVQASYVFKTSDGFRWSQMQRLTHAEPAGEGLPLTTPSLWGGNLIYRGNQTAELYSQYHNGSCLLIWMSDHFLDGWDIAVLTVVAPDNTNDTFHPHCWQRDPFFVRYCPYQPEDEGVYVVKVFAPTDARFFWEINYQVYLESTGVWYKGDYASKMKFYFHKDTKEFVFYDGENLIDMEAPCYRCTSITQQNWAQLKDPGGISFFPLVAQGATYYISDNEGRLVSSVGRVCNGVERFECYQTIKDGTYVLRLGGGLFGDETHFPRVDSRWEGCGRSGDHRDQFTFKIVKGQCYPLSVQRYPYSRLDRCSVTTQAPSPAPTPAPTAPTISMGRRLDETHEAVSDGSKDTTFEENRRRRLSVAVEVDADRIDQLFIP